MSVIEVKNSIVIESERRLFLAKLGESIAEDFCAGLDQVDPALILREHGVTLSFDHYGEYFDGMLHHEAGRFHVYCNEARCGPRHEGRARFTLAHELGHFFIPEHYAALCNGVAPHHPSFCNKSNAQPYVEVEADFFASRLLMPESLFAATVRRFGWDMAGLRKTANTLGTSLQSTARRFIDSVDFPCAFVVWREGKEPWFGISTAFRLYGFSYFTPHAGAAINGSATAIALAEDVQPFSDIRQSMSVASIWFRGVSPGDRRDVPLHEEALKTAYGTITWITPPLGALTAVPLS